MTEGWCRRERVSTVCESNGRKTWSASVDIHSPSVPHSECLDEKRVDVSRVSHVRMASVKDYTS